ncbi:MAG: hypothetical protein CVU97_01935 [Firmicutes bacterium HGW-Firmicutes-21]|nr:MAG: hypothetical protein CVU97_01935 [Firmicutes bacterium HGW-Firmicutes-21]
MCKNKENGLVFTVCAEERNNIMDHIRIDEHPKPIRGISCSVTNCFYHDGQTHCVAGKIAVGPSTATASRDTICATFKLREE